MKNQENKLVNVPSKMEEAETLQDQVVFALARLGKGTTDQVVKKMEELLPKAPDKELIAGTHEVLTQLFEKGLLTGSESEGNIVYGFA